MSDACFPPPGKGEVVVCGSIIRNEREGRLESLDRAVEVTLTRSITPILLEEEESGSICAICGSFGGKVRGW